MNLHTAPPPIRSIATAPHGRTTNALDSGPAGQVQRISLNGSGKIGEYRVAVAASRKQAVLDHPFAVQFVDQKQADHQQHQRDRDAGQARRLPISGLLVVGLVQHMIVLAHFHPPHATQDAR